MPERVLVLPAPQHAHRRLGGLQRTLDVAARAGSIVTLGGLLAFAGVAVATTAPAGTQERVVTFEIAGHR